MLREKAIGFEIKTVSNLIKRNINCKLYRANKLDQSTAMHGWIIGYLSHRPDQDVFQKDIEQEFSIRRSTATGLLQLMEKKGLIIREPVNYDARLKKIVLTQKAIEAHKMIEREMDMIDKKLESCLTKEELEEFFVIMEKLKSTLKD